MDKLKQWIAFTVLGVFAVLAAGWFLLVSPKRADADALRQQAAKQVADTSTLETRLAVLKSQAKDLPQQQAKLAAVAAKIPDNPAQPALIRALSSAATAAGVELISIAPSAPTAAIAATVTAPVAPVAASGSPAAASPAAGKLPAATAATTVGALQSIPVAINIAGSYFQIEQFLDGLENLSRATKVTGFGLAPGPNPVKPASTGSGAAPVDNGKTLVTTINAQVFMAPGRAPAPAVTVPTPAKPSSPTVQPTK